MMVEGMKERNWNITSIGATSILLTGLGFLAYLVYRISMQATGELYRPVIMAAAAGITFAFSSKIGDLDRLKTLMKPLSGFMNLIAGALLVASIILFLSSSLQIALETFSQFQGDSILGLLRAVILPIVGYIGMLLGSFIAATGSSLVFWDRVGERIPVKAERTDFIFTGVLATLTVIGVFGTAILQQLPLQQYIEDLMEFAVSANEFSAFTTGVLLFVTYRAVRAAWKVLPIRESVPRSSREQYDKLKKPETVVRWIVVPALSIATAAQGFLDNQYLDYLEPLTGSGIRSLMLGVTAVSIIIYLVVKVLKILTTDREKIKRLIPYTLFGLVAYMIAPFLVPYIDPLIGQMPDFVAGAMTPLMEAVGQTQMIMILMTAASAAAVVLKIWMGLLRGFGLVPEGLEGTTLVASGVFFSAIGFHIYQPDVTLLFVGVAAAMASWEIGKRSVILGREIGRSGSTYQAELVQLVSKIIIAFVAVLAARTLLVAVNNMNITVEGSTGFLVFLLTIIGIGFLTASMKDFT
jgi:hypothetical protein